MLLKGHSDSVTGLRVSPDGGHLLSNAMDNTLREWDVRPYAPPNRCTKVFTGHMHNFEKNLLRCDYAADGSKVACGSADRMVRGGRVCQVCGGSESVHTVGCVEGG